jgi:FtsZ-binding cell division protein ZapB
MPPDVEPDSLVRLEERILRTVELVARLRQEKEAAEREAVEARAQAARAVQELEQVRSERKQVRTRIEKLLGQMDLIGGE